MVREILPREVTLSLTLSPAAPVDEEYKDSKQVKDLIRGVLKAVRNPRLVWRRVVLVRMPHVLKVSYRVVVSKVGILRTRYIKKSFENTQIGRTCFEHEMLADEIFGGFPWHPPIVRKGSLCFVRSFYPETNRLDLIASKLPEATRRRIATEAVSILFDIFCAGYAHRDIHAGNMYWINGGLKVTDYEWMEAYPSGQRPPFPLCYDITGKGLESPGHTTNMCYIRKTALSLQNVLGVPIECALDEFKKELKGRLRRACETFATGGKRHVCSARRIYSSFRLPYFSVEVSEAQRDSESRFRTFGIDRDTVRNKRVLDLGSNIGGIVFELQGYEPAECLGVEYDADKISLATQIAAFNGLHNVSFIHADVDSLKAESIEGPFDVVFCLAIQAHVKKPDRLFRLLSQVTRGVLYFEGNSNSDRQTIEHELTSTGFTRVEYLGFGDDDCITTNNRRPMLRASK